MYWTTWPNLSPSASFSARPLSQDGAIASASSNSGLADLNPPSDSAPNDQTKERIETILQSEVRRNNLLGSEQMS